MIYKQLPDGWLKNVDCLPYFENGNGFECIFQCNNGIEYGCYMNPHVEKKVPWGLKGECSHRKFINKGKLNHVKVRDPNIKHLVNCLN